MDAFFTYKTDSTGKVEHVIFQFDNMEYVIAPDYRGGGVYIRKQHASETQRHDLNAPNITLLPCDIDHIKIV